MEGEDGGGFGDGAEGGVVDAFEMVLGVEFVGAAKDGGVGGGIGADEHLGALAGGEGRGFGGVGFAFFGMALVDFLPDMAHGLFGAEEVFFGGEGVEALLGGEFDVDADAVGVLAGEGDERLRGFGDGFEVDVASKMMDLAQFTGDVDDEFHGMVGAADDAAAEEEAFDVIAFVEVEGELDDFVGGEAGAGDVAGAAVDAVVAVVEAGVGHEDLEEGDAAAVGGIGVADAGAAGGANALAAA